MPKLSYNLSSEVIKYPGMAGWHFLFVNKTKTAEIAKKMAGKTKGWGSVPVTVTVGKTKWKTSIFPDKKTGTYFLPLKAEVRKKEGIEAGEVVKFKIEI